MPEGLRHKEEALIARLQALMADYQKEMGGDVTGEKALMFAEAIKILESISPSADDAVGKMALLEAAISKDRK